MRTTIEMAREAGIRDCTCNGTLGCLERFAELVRADERARMAEQPAQQCWKCGDMDAAFQAKCDVPACGMKEPALAEQPAQQEPVAWMSPSWIDPDTRGWQSDSFESIPIEGWLPIYTSPPTQRTWVGLSEEDREQHRDDWHSNIHDKEFRAIEAKLKEKNNG